jgi:BirA family biotin operon repressor/biotin-[acetyl-CoA-carboxylase] ligase
MTLLGPSFGGRTIQLETVDSTNSYAARLLHDSVPQGGTAIMALFQQAGKGQRGTTWDSEEGKNLLVSYITYPGFLHPQDQFQLSQMVSLALADTIQTLSGSRVSIKWPNDIMVDGMKIAGILIENAIRNNTITHSIIGIGVNVNQTAFRSFSPPATSLKMLKNIEFDIAECFETLNKNLDKWYLQLKTGKDRKIREEYLEYLYLKGQESGYECKSGRFRGTIRDVLPDGSLEMVNAEGKKLLFRNKEVKFTG